MAVKGNGGSSVTYGGARDYTPSSSMAGKHAMTPYMGSSGAGPSPSSVSAATSMSESVPGMGGSMRSVAVHHMVGEHTNHSSRHASTHHMGKKGRR